MNATHSIAIILLAVEALVLVAVLLRMRKRQSRPFADRRSDQSADGLAREIQKAIDEMNGQMNDRLAELDRILLAVRRQGLRPGPIGEPTDPPCERLSPRRQDSPPMARPEADALDPPANGKAGQPVVSEIRRLAQQGLNGEEIARCIDRPVGEVLLIMRLQQTPPQTQ